MLVLFYIIISIELITVFYNLIKFLIYKLNRKSNLKKLSSHNENFHINVLIPCYKEINVIKETLEHFKKEDEELFFITGADCLLNLEKWKNIKKLV